MKKLGAKKNKNIGKLACEQVVNHSGWSLPCQHHLLNLRSGFYSVRDQAIMGDAPKSFIHLYEYGIGRKANPRTWPAYIAKVGQKWYPIESITEHFLTRLGQRLGFVVADSILLVSRGQLRFCSKYFLRPDESLIHGAELFWGYLEDKELVEEIERKKEARNVFTYQFVQDAILNRFPADADKLVDGFVEMLLFDGLIGNNDRHYFNWGIIADPESRRPCRFAPIYDTARALFWNTSEAKLEQLIANRLHYQRKLENYAKRSCPKIGWDNKQGLNHFDLIRALVHSADQWKVMARKVIQLPVLEAAAAVMQSHEFHGLLSLLRQQVMLDCLKVRLRFLEDCVSN